MLFIDQMLHACDDVRLVCVYSAFSPSMCPVCVQEKGKGQLQQLQEDADQVVVIMQQNFNKVGEREEKLEELDKRADALLKSGKQFRKSTRKVRRKTETENARLRCKNWRVIAGIVVLIIIITIIIIAVLWPR
ncbi:vesicle-associated membrane protein 3-like isoform X1 [Ictalurus furcatus]|uniref:vesicle-associated membrane protein 3-like isoform X1 n=1 Tax=Ictalurus furcatus TaxID=66913 RepID=UPI0023502BD1|nr:vesicle-associated membrane protein 3-like isoform X1 [Ictalurus furcatus]